jgi:hypothetical protein
LLYLFTVYLFLHNTQILANYKMSAIESNFDLLPSEVSAVTIKLRVRIIGIRILIVLDQNNERNII